MDESVRGRIAEIAQNAIQEIGRISQLVTGSSTGSSRIVSPSPSGLSVVTGSSTGSSRIVSPSPSGFSGSSRGIQPSTGNSRPSDRSALNELRSRFPTLSSSTGSDRPRNGSNRRRNNSSASAGRPGKYLVIKDIVVVGAQVDGTPLGRHDRVKLERKNRVITGFTFNKSWDEKTLYKKVKEQFPEDCKGMDFDFVKNCYGTLVKPTLPSGVKIDGNILLKSIASTSVVYVKLFADDFDNSEDSGPETNPLDVLERVGSFEHSSNMQDTNEEDHVPVLEQPEIDIEELREINEITKQIIKECEHSQNPVEILKCAQDKILTGRQLEITDPTSEIEGETNFILVDRENLFQTGLDEISNLTNLRNPIEVNFIGETARDYGGPRKEFFRLMLTDVKEKLFDGGLRPDLAEKYTTCGVVMGLSVLQNGKIPQFLPEEMLNTIVGEASLSPCLTNLRKGLCKVGILQLMINLPQFLHLFRPSDASALTVKKLVHLLNPSFSDEGSNARKYQKEVYNAFIRYIREVSAGRREAGSVTLTLGHILQFVCGTDEEPMLGFAKCPEIHFVEYHNAYLPSANTCINVLNLPRPSITNNLPPDEVLFNLYDYSFGSAYFGIV